MFFIFVFFICAYLLYFGTTKHLKVSVLFVNLLFYISSICFLLYYDPYIGGYQYLFFFSWLDFFFIFGLDALSLLFMFLTSFLFCLCYLYSINTVYLHSKIYIFILFFLELLLFFVFAVLDFFLFYIAFEAILLPIFLFIGLFGSRTRKIHAGYLLFFYTFFGSLFMLLTFLVLFSTTGSFYFDLLANTEFSFFRESFLFLIIFFSFAIKIPMFPFHIWLPEAHVEAPTEGSVLLAGVLLKLGSYGFLRILIPFFYKSVLFFLPFIFLISAIGIIYTSLVTLRQSDLKKIIAYSSIAHMNIAVIGLFTLNFTAVTGSFIIFISHGFISASLFFLIGMLYDRSKTRLVKYYSGLVYLMPITSFFFFFFIISNISFPGTLSFIGEFFVLFPLFFISKTLFFFVLLGIFLCTVYSLFLFTKIFYGLLNYNYIFFLQDVIRTESNVLVPSLFFVLFYGLFPVYIFSFLELNVLYAITNMY